jgi:MEDS: MEthanogen/methylotroph, DcmR Sensory domain
VTAAVTEAIGAANLISYESQLNLLLPRYPQVMLCLYDLNQFRGDLLIDIMKTHPQVLMGHTVLDNLYYIAPDELAATRR